MTDFMTKNREKLEQFAAMSQAAGSRSDYVQGGGGNTSVKLADGLMAIKASGYCLSDIRPDKAYAVLDYEALRRFYYGNEPAQLADVEKLGSACAKENTKLIEGMDALRPSVEAGFHSILKTFVCHTHSVYANLAACSTACCEIAEKAFNGADYTWGWVPYTDPGANLTFAIRDELRRVEEKTGKVPSVILMQNHGIIVHDDDAERCLAIHADANERLAQQFGIHGDSFPAISVRQTGEELYEADTPYLREALKNCRYDYKTFIETPLYPDQMVFLIGTFFMDKEGTPAEGECYADTRTGALVLHMGEKKAKTIAETLTAVIFIMDTVAKMGYTVSTMGEAAKSFIANWESEKYRKSLAGKKG